MKRGGLEKEEVEKGEGKKRGDNIVENEERTIMAFALYFTVPVFQNPVFQTLSSRDIVDLNTLRGCDLHARTLRHKTWSIWNIITKKLHDFSCCTSYSTL